MATQTKTITTREYTAVSSGNANVLLHMKQGAGHANGARVHLGTAAPNKDTPDFIPLDLAQKFISFSDLSSQNVYVRAERADIQIVVMTN